MSRIALMGDNSIEYVSTLLDIWNNGDCAVLLDWRIPFDTAYKLMLEAGIKECFIDRRLSIDEFHTESVSVSFHTYSVSDNGTHVLPNSIRKKYLANKSRREAVVLYSSGTTGKSKGIILSHNAITTNANSILDYMKLTCSDCLYIAKSLSHSSTLVGELLVALLSGAEVILGPTVVPPRYVLSRILEYSVTTLCLNPTLLQMYAEEQKKNKYNLNSLKKVYCSGAILDDRVYEKAHEIFGGIGVYNVYGLTEAGPRVAAQRADCCKSNSVGKAINGVEIIVVDENGMPVPNKKDGIVHVCSPSLFFGYVSGMEKHKSLYRGWLNTGDIGHVDKNGELHITGRIDDLTIIDAHKIYLHDVEQAILKNTCVTDCIVVRYVKHGTNTLSLGCVYVSDTDFSVEDNRKLGRVLSTYEMPKRYLRVKELPRNQNGKIMRGEAMKLLK